MNKRSAATKAAPPVKAKRKTRPSAGRKENERKLTLANPPTGFVMSVDDLAELIDRGRNQAYEAVHQGLFPSIRTKGGKINVLVQPTLQILRGEIPPGRPKA